MVPEWIHVGPGEEEEGEFITARPDNIFVLSYLLFTLARKTLETAKHLQSGP